MRNCNHCSIRQQIDFLKRQFLQESDRLFTDVLTDETLAPALEAIGSWKRSNLYPIYHAFPDSIIVREARAFIKQLGFRTRSIVVIMTLLDPVQYPKEELALLCRTRWNNEMDLRSIKSVMQMECLR